MAYPRRKNKFQGLGKVDVIFQDDSPTSTIFQVHEFPDVVPQGKSSFLVDGSNLLKPNVELKIEILDNEGETIYTEPVPNYLEGTARRVSMEVYSETAPGAATIHILGELDPAEYLNQTGQVIPEEFQGAYNVRWTRQFYVNTAIPNTFPILFYRQPQVRVFEILKGHQITPPEPIRTIESGSLSLLPTPAGQQEIPPSPDIDPEGGAGKLPTEKESDKLGKFFDKLENSFETKAFSTSKPSFRRRGRIQRRSSPEVKKAGGFTKVDDTTGLPKDDSLQFETKKVGGVVEINPPTGTHNLSRLIPVDKLPDSFPSELIKEVEEGGKTIRVLDDDKVEVPSTFTSNVVDVINDHQFFLEDDFTIKDKSTGIEYIAPLDLTAPASGGEASIVSGSVVETQATMSYVEPINRIISATHFRSFADLRLSSMRTFSGDIFKIKVLARSQGSYGDFESIYEAPMEAPEVLVDTSLEGRFENIGFFHSQSIVDRFWTSGSAQTHVSRSNNFITDAIKISGSNAGARESNKFITQNNYTIDNENVGYTLRTKVFGTKAPKVQRSGNSKVEGQLRFKLSGSAFGGSTVDNQDVDYRWLGDLDFEDYPSSLQQDFGVVETEFVPDTTGSFKLEIEALSGEWHLGDVSITPNQETNFSPDFSRLIVPMPKQQIRPDFHDFIIEFYDINNNVAEMFAFTESVKFEGENIVIDSGDNLLSGSMFIGNSTGSGIEMAGVSSGFIRSIGYQGFASASAGEGTAGFMLYSGSVKVGPADSDGQGTESGDNYDGVGLELHDGASGSLRFRTDLGVFEVQTPSFFLGSNNQFVSGAEGNVEISSSNFHLTPEGNVTMSGTITATAGNIGNWQIIDGKLSGSNATLDADGAALYKTDQGPGSDQSTEAYLFPVRSNEYYIDFTPEGASPTSSGYFVKFGPRFAVDKDGVLFASGAVFEGSITASAGLIGGFQTDSSSFSSQQIFISGSPLQGGVDDPKYMFISTSNFNVKQDGSVTGSSILLGDQAGGNFLQFDGSTLTVQGNITADNISTPSAAPTPSASISSEGFASFVSASIAGFEISTDEIKSSNESLRLKSGGQITGSNVLFTGGEIGGFQLNSNSISSSNGNLRLKSNGQITGSEVLLDGGEIGGFSLDATSISSSNNNLILRNSGQITGSDVLFDGGVIGGFGINDSALFDTSGQFFLSGSASGDQMFISSSNFNVKGSGKLTASAALISGSDVDINVSTFVLDSDNFDVTADGRVTMSAAQISGSDVEITVDALAIDSTNFDLTLDGRVTGSEVLFTGGEIGGFGISDSALSDISGAFYLSGSASGPPTVNGTQNNFISASDFVVSAQGKVTASAALISGSDVVISTDTFKLDTTSLGIDSNTARFDVISASGVQSDGRGVFVRIGEISDNTATDLFGMKIFDGTGTGSEDTLVKLGEEGNTIAGWTIANDTISSNNLVIHSSGRLETSDFASDVKGWRISSEGNGTAEFENIKVRGTLATAVFEKETVNAVGGQLYVANSTAITASAWSGSHVSASDTTMSVANVSGFTGSYYNDGEILALKKVSSTGFATEYVLVQSASRNFPDSDSDFSGDLYVTRGYGANDTFQDTSSFGDFANNSQSYEEGQVLVSTGRIGTGYVRINANPTDTTTPYIDIVERTGSSIYATELKVRLGDLSGLSSGLLYGNASPGFGLFTENVFLQGAITAQTGSFTGIVHIGQTGQEIKLGISASGGNDDGIHINDNNYWYSTGNFKVGSSTNFLQNSSGNITIVPDTFTVNTSDGSFRVSSSEQVIALGSTGLTSDGIFLSGSGEYNLQSGSSNFIRHTQADGLQIRNNQLKIDTVTLDMDTANGGTIALGGTAPTNLSSDGIFFSGSGEFNLQKDSNEYLRFTNSAGLELKAENLNINTSTFDVQTDAGGVLALGSSAAIDGDGIFMSGSGVFNLRQSSTEYLRNTGGSLEIKTTDLDLNAGNKLILSSSLNNGTIALGTNAHSMTSTTGTGFIVNGNGQFRVGEGTSGTNFLFYNGSGALQIQTENFGLATPTLQITGSSTQGRIAMGSTIPQNLSSNGILLSGSGEFNLQTDSSNFIRQSGGTFSLQSQNATISGSSVNIGAEDFDLQASTLRLQSAAGGKLALGGTLPTNLSSNGIFLSGSGEFNFQNGAKNFVRQSGGSFSLGSEIFSLDAGTMILSSSQSNGRIAMGSTPPSASNSGTGFYADGDGNFLAGNSGGNRIQHVNGTINLQSNTFSLDATTIIIDSATNSGKIALGASPNSNVDGTNAGIYMDGTGDLLVRADADNFIKFDQDATPKLEMKADTFFLGGSGQFVSGSQGNIEISSSAFHLTPQGNVTASSILLGDKSGGNFLQFQGSTLTVQGSITADSISTPSAASTPSSSISADGFATFKSASIADFEILPGKLFNSDVSGTIGLVTSDHANSAVGGVASFYAGATGDEGQAAKISFGSDGRIRGSGAYVRDRFGDESEFLIAATTVFGGGEDGDLMIQSNGSGGSLKVWKDGNQSSTPGQTIGAGSAGNIASVNYADVMMRKLATAGNVVELARDVYLRIVIFDVTQGDLYVNTNGFRFFASEGIFIYGTVLGDNKVVIRNNGGDGAGGSGGNNGDGDRDASTFPVAAGGTGGAGGAAGAPGAGGTLAAPASGSAGASGGQGADIKSGGSTGAGTPAVGTAASTPSAAQDGLSNSLPNISPLSPVGGSAGGAGGPDSSGTAAASAGSGGAAVSNVQAGIQWLSTPVDSIIKFRAEFGTNDYPIRLIPSPSNVGGSGGSGGGGSTAIETGVAQASSSFAGGGGGGGGGAGGNGGSVLVCAKFIDFWKSANTYNRQKNAMNIYNPGANSQYGDLKIQADGGNGGRGGDGGQGGDNLI